MKFPQIVILTVYLVVLLWSANQHGQHRRGTENFWVTLVTVAAHLVVLAFGGFFAA